MTVKSDEVNVSDGSSEAFSISEFPIELSNFEIHFAKVSSGEISSKYNLASCICSSSSFLISLISLSSMRSTMLLIIFFFWRFENDIFSFKIDLFLLLLSSIRESNFGKYFDNSSCSIGVGLISKFATSAACLAAALAAAIKALLSLLQLWLTNVNIRASCIFDSSTLGL